MIETCSNGESMLVLGKFNGASHIFVLEGKGVFCPPIKWPPKRNGQLTVEFLCCFSKALRFAFCDRDRTADDAGKGLSTAPALSMLEHERIGDSPSVPANQLTSVTKLSRVLSRSSI